MLVAATYAVIQLPPHCFYRERMNSRAFCLGCAALLIAALGCSSDQSAPEMNASSADDQPTVLYQEDFDDYEEGTRPADWWVEGGESVEVQDGRLLIKSDPAQERAPGYVATVWNREGFSGDLRIEFDAQVVASSMDVNNINFFLNYSHPSPDSTLYETRQSRADASYAYYHELNGYIFTFVKSGQREENQARFRMRRCPGFELIDENHAFNSEQGRTYHITILKEGNRLTYIVDGTAFLQSKDEKYNWTEGLAGIRTFHTDLWIDNFTVTRPNQ